MIQLYEPSNKNHEMNGEVLHPTRCEASFILKNGAWFLELECPFHPDIVTNAVLAVPTPYGKKQLYRIKDTEKNDDYSYATAYPIFLDAKNDCFLFDVRPTNKNGQEALDIMLNGSKYSASSNISRKATSYFYNKNFIESLNGNDENSFINRWGGEIAYNNYQVIVNERLGSDKGMRAEFGFNLTGINETVDMSNVVTSIIPIAYNGRMLPDKETVDSPLINNYPIVYIEKYKYEDIRFIEDIDENEDLTEITVCNTLEELYAALRSRASSEYDAGIDRPKITYEINIIDVSKTDLYKDFEQITAVNLGDTVHCKNKRLNIETSARVIEMTYDCILEKVIDLKLGDYVPSYFDNMTDNSAVIDKVVNKESNTLVGEKIAGLINLFQTKLTAQRNAAQKQTVRAILFEDLDPNSPTYGATCYGTAGLEFTTTRNETDTDWIWTNSNAFGPQGLIASAIITGLLSDKLGNNYWDLDKGILSTKLMKAVDADISGKLTSTTGEIGGFNITKEGLVKTHTTKLKKVYTMEDAERMRDIVEGKISPTQEDYDLYDANGNGIIDANDYIRIKNYYINAQSDVIYTDLIINSYALDLTDTNARFITLRYRNPSGKIIASTSIGPRYLDTNNITTVYLNAMDIAIEGEPLGVRAGEWWDCDEVDVCGYVTGDGKTLWFSIPVGPRMININSVTCTSLRLNLRRAEGGYIGEGYESGGYEYINEENYSVSATPMPSTNTILISMKQNVAYGTANNTPVSVSVLSASFEFE